jgi:hypothetical protein
MFDCLRKRLCYGFFIADVALYAIEIGVAIAGEWVRSEVVSCDLAPLCCSSINHNFVQYQRQLMVQSLRPEVQL